MSLENQKWSYTIPGTHISEELFQKILKYNTIEEVKGMLDSCVKNNYTYFGYCEYTGPNEYICHSLDIGSVKHMLKNY